MSKGQSTKSAYPTRNAHVMRKSDEEAAARDVSALFRRGVEATDAGPGSLHRTVRMLLLCRTRSERQIVGLVDYQGLAVATAAGRIGMCPGRAREVWESLVSRLRQAEERHHRDEVLARNGV